MLTAIQYRLNLNVCLILTFAALFAGGQNVASVHAQGQTSTGADQTHLYFFTSDGCAPCEIVKPTIARLAASGYPTTTVNVRQRADWAKHFQVSRTPTVILVHNEKMVGRREGMIRHGELIDWFNAVGYSNTAATQPPRQMAITAPGRTKQPVGTKVVLHDNVDGTFNAGGSRPSTATSSSATTAQAFRSPTMHQGTTRPANSAEEIAMAATVKLQVEDPEGISYATGTVIHTHKNESLVLTCGHVFRDSAGKGVITAHYGFNGPQPRSGPGELVYYDADARDIAVVVIQTTGTPIKAVEVASKRTRVAKGNGAFSIGCDHGEDPTIRHTQIKNRAAYDGAIKYDIYGRPVDGRSGGGLFLNDGRIVGVCNAAVVDVDEGIYTALDTIHWQLAEVKLDHLFDPNQALAMVSPTVPADRSMSLDRRLNRRLNDSNDNDRNESFPSRPPTQPKFQPTFPESKPLTLPPSPELTRDLVGGSVGNKPSPQFPPARPESANQGRTRLVSLGGETQDGQSDQAYQNARSGSEMADYNREVLIIVRSKDDRAPAQTITIDNPSHKLVDYLQRIHPHEKTVTNFDVARYRQEELESGVRRPFRDRMGGTITNTTTQLR